MATQVDQFIDYWSTKRISKEEKKALWSNIPVLRQMQQIIVNQFGGVYNLSNLDNAFSQVRDLLYPPEAATATSQTEAAERRLESEREKAKQDHVRNVNSFNHNSTVSSLVENAKNVQKRVDESTQIAAKQAAEEIVAEAIIARNGRPVHSATAELKKGLSGIFAYTDPSKRVVDWVSTVELRRRFLKAAQEQSNNTKRQTW